MIRTLVDDLIFRRWADVECSVRNRILCGYPHVFRRTRSVSEAVLRVFGEHNHL